MPVQTYRHLQDKHHLQAKTTSFQMEEVALYQVAGGKVVREEFFYDM